MAVKENVEEIISGNTIAIFSKSYCPYCKATKTLITSKYKDVPTKILELDTLDEGSQIQDYLEEKTGQSTVPNIFINQTHIGGNSDLQSKYQAGELDAIVKGQPLSA